MPDLETSFLAGFSAVQVPRNGFLKRLDSSCYMDSKYKNECKSRKTNVRNADFYA